MLSAHVLASLKAYVALVGSIVTALLGIYTADTRVGQVLTVIAVIATAFGTWLVPYNANGGGDEPPDDSPRQVFNEGH